MDQKDVVNPLEPELKIKVELIRTLEQDANSPSFEVDNWAEAFAYRSEFSSAVEDKAAFKALISRNRVAIIDGRRKPVDNTMSRDLEDEGILAVRLANERSKKTENKLEGGCLVLTFLSGTDEQFQAAAVAQKNAPDLIEASIKVDLQAKKQAKQQEIEQTFFRKAVKSNLGFMLRWLNPFNGFLLSAGAIAVGAIIFNHFFDSFPVASTSLFGIAGAAAGLGMVILPFFAAWEMYKHFNTYRFEEWKKAQTEERKGANVSYAAYLTAGDANKIGYGDYLKNLATNLIEDAKKHPVKACIIAVGVVLAALVLAASIGYILGNPFSVDLLGSFFDFMNNFINSGLSGLFGFDALPALGTQIVGLAVITTAVLAVTDLFVRGYNLYANSKEVSKDLSPTVDDITEVSLNRAFVLDNEEEASLIKDMELCECNPEVGARAAAFKFWSDAYTATSTAISTAIKNSNAKAM